MRKVPDPELVDGKSPETTNFAFATSQTLASSPPPHALLTPPCGVSFQKDSRIAMWTREMTETGIPDFHMKIQAI